MSNPKKVWFEVWVNGVPLSAEGKVLKYHEAPRSGHPMLLLNLDLIARHVDPDKIEIKELSE